MRRTNRLSEANGGSSRNFAKIVWRCGWYKELNVSNVEELAAFENSGTHLEKRDQHFLEQHLETDPTLRFEVFEHCLGYYEKQYALQIIHATVITANYTTYYLVLDSFAALLA